jgi:AraC-like DNA-binding protein
MLQPHLTISIALVNGMLSGVRAHGEAVEPFLAIAGIAPELLDQPGSRVSAAQYVLLHQTLIDKRADEGLGFLSNPLKSGSFALVTRSCITASTLEVAMRRISRSFSLLQDDVSLELARAGTNAGFALRFHKPAIAHAQFFHELMLRVFWQLLVWLIDSRLPVTGFDFAFASPSYVDSYDEIFPASLRFGCARSAFWFDAEHLKQPLRRDDASLRLFLAGHPANVILPPRNEGMANAVRNHLQRVLPRWADLGETADALHVSPPTLQRRLATEKTTFQVLKDELRRDMAITRLHTSAVTFSALAGELGFADSAAFQRAFKNWTGSAPGAYRQSKA